MEIIRYKIDMSVRIKVCLDGDYMISELQFVPKNLILKPAL